MFKSYIKTIIGSITVCIIISAVLKIYWEKEDYESRIENLQIELAHSNIPMTSDVINDSIPVATQHIIEIDKHATKDVVDKQLITALKLKIKQISSQQTTTTITGDTIIVKSRNDCFTYKDSWTEFRLRDSIFSYSVKDSIAAIVFREYKHHFLFWKWGTKRYSIKLVNFNPHSQISYNQYIKVL